MFQKENSDSNFLTLRKEFKSKLADSTLEHELKYNYLLTLMYFSQIGYFSFDTIRMLLEDLGVIDFKVFNVKETQAYYAEFDTFEIVSFRGTEKGHSRDILLDLRFWKRRFFHVRVHKGFADGVDRVGHAIASYVQQKNTGKRLIYTGHSLGGALATLLTFYHKPRELCTFGCPKVGGDERFERHFDTFTSIRVYTTWDWIRILPPFFFGYYHVGSAVELPSSINPFHAHRISSYIDGVVQRESGTL